MSPTLQLVAKNTVILRRVARGASHLQLMPGTGKAVPTGKPAHCLDCATCSGACAAYLDAANIPDTILGRRQRRS